MRPVPKYALSFWSGRAALFALAPCLALSLFAATQAFASDREHKVRGGQTMAAIARRYGVTVWSLAAANNLKPDQQIQAGQVLSVPDKGVVYVNPGQTLWSVARRHSVSVDDLARANGLRSSSSLRPGMRLVLPGQGGGKGHGETGKAAKSWGTPKRPGRVTLYRVATKKSATISLTDARGRVRSSAVNQLARFLRPKHSRAVKPPPRRLLSLLARVSDHFGGRKLHVVSGYRRAGGFTKHASRHVAGAAIDFRVEGVPNAVLRDYLRHLEDVGVGFYPNSSFVHFDVRDKNAYWIDLSGPGQKPRYLQRGQRDGYDEAERKVTDTPIDALVAEALEEMEHEEPAPEESDDE
jgi:uncharacterized protein YcbK (DUF882 family)